MQKQDLLTHPIEYCFRVSAVDVFSLYLDVYAHVDTMDFTRMYHVLYSLWSVKRCDNVHVHIMFTFHIIPYVVGAGGACVRAGFNHTNAKKSLLPFVD